MCTTCDAKDIDLELPEPLLHKAPSRSLVTGPERISSSPSSGKRNNVSNFNYYEFVAESIFMIVRALLQVIMYTSVV